MPKFNTQSVEPFLVHCAFHLIEPFEEGHADADTWPGDGALLQSDLIPDLVVGEKRRSKIKILQRGSYNPTLSRSSLANATNAGEMLSPVGSHTKMVAAPRCSKETEGARSPSAATRCWVCLFVFVVVIVVVRVVVVSVMVLLVGSNGAGIASMRA